jgi:hypothetical protein
MPDIFVVNNATACGNRDPNLKERAVKVGTKKKRKGE